MEKIVPEKWVLYVRHTLSSPMDIGVHASADEPVLRRKAAESEGLKKVAPFKCLTSEFKRPIHEIGDAWMELGEKATASGLSTTDHDREVYRVMDCDHPANNDIELQLGVR